MAKALTDDIRVILFDADKTLYAINTENAYSKVYSFLSDELKVAKETLQKEHKEEILKIKESLEPAKRDYRHTLEQLIRKRAKKNVSHLTDTAYQMFWNQIVDDLEKDEDTIDLLETLSKKYILAVATDEFYPLVERKLNKVLGNWKDYFHTIISADKLNTMKPSSKYYEEAMTLFKVKPSELVMIGDSWKRDLEPAKVLGIFTILVNEKEEGSPDVHIKKLSQLTKIF